MCAASTLPADMLHLEAYSCHVRSPILLRLPPVLANRLYEILTLYEETVILAVPPHASLSAPSDNNHVKDLQAKTAQLIPSQIPDPDRNNKLK